MEIKVKVETVPATSTINDFSLSVKRKRSQIARGIAEGDLDYSYVMGKKVVVLNDKAALYSKNCKLRDKIKN